MTDALPPEKQLARTLALALRADFAEREATALQLAELLLDAVASALPLTRHEPAEPALAQLETLATQVDVYSWEGAPGWDVVLARGLRERAPLEPGPSVLDGLGASREHEAQRGELKRRARAEAARLVSLGREAARFDAGGAGSGAQALDQVPTLDAAQAVVAVHASLLRLCGHAAVASLLFLPEDAQAGALPEASTDAFVREIDERGEGFTAAHDEWLALLTSRNPAAAQSPSFRTFFVGLSQTLRLAVALRRFRDEARAGKLADDAEALLGALGGWQPVRWQSLRAGAPPQWIADLCPAAPPRETPLQRLARECDAALGLASRLWSAKNASLTAFSALAALLASRCASAAALWEELGGGAGSS
jgi:hypothetical protein